MSSHLCPASIQLKLSVELSAQIIDMTIAHDSSAPSFALDKSWLKATMPSVLIYDNLVLQLSSFFTEQHLLSGFKGRWVSTTWLSKCVYLSYTSLLLQILTAIICAYLSKTQTLVVDEFTIFSHCVQTEKQHFKFMFFEKIWPPGQSVHKWPGVHIFYKKKKATLTLTVSLLAKYPLTGFL